MANAHIFNYSKWDKIELSDDESDLHPNIDKDSWFRMKHRSRVEREDKEDGEVLCYNKENSEDQSRLNIIKSRIKGLKSGQSTDEDAELEDMDALIGEADELENRISLRKKRIWVWVNAVACSNQRSSLVAKCRRSKPCTKNA